MVIPGQEPVLYHTHGGGELHSHSHNGHTHHHHHHHESNSHQSRVVTLENDILESNSLSAQRNRGYFEALSLFAINFVSSPGSGKTTLLEKTLEGLQGESRFYVIEGDQQTSNDADRIAKYNTPVIQINTGKMCHLDADMVRQAVKTLGPETGSFVFIENVGNLVCPALFDLGENKRVVIMSVTEGTDKAIKYPEMFHTADLCIINKTDLLPYVDFDVAKAREYALQVNHHLGFIEMSATSGEGMEDWFTWLRQQSIDS